MLNFQASSAAGLGLFFTGSKHRFNSFTELQSLISQFVLEFIVITLARFDVLCEALADAATKENKVGSFSP